MFCLKEYILSKSRVLSSITNALCSSFDDMKTHIHYKKKELDDIKSECGEKCERPG